MDVRVFQQFTGALLAASVAAEAYVLTRASDDQWSDAVYFNLHTVLSLAVIGALVALYRSHRARPQARAALWFAAGMVVTTIGDIVNSGISGIEPVSTKLSWALLLFGLGYVLYIVAIVRFLASRGGFPKPLALAGLVIAVLTINVFSWSQYVEPNVSGLELLAVGSFAFNATIYVALPICGVLFYRNTGYATTGLLVLLGTLLIPFSDLILFDSWLAAGDADTVSRSLYAANWIVYFGGQILAAQFPAAVLADSDSLTPSTPRGS